MLIFFFGEIARQQWMQASKRSFRFAANVIYPVLQIQRLVKTCLAGCLKLTLCDFPLIPSARSAAGLLELFIGLLKLEALKT